MSCSAWRPISLQKAAGLGVTSDSSVRSGFLRNWPFFCRLRQSHGQPEPHATWISHQLLQLPARFSHFGCRLRWRSWFSHIRAAARGFIREQIRSGPTQTHKDHHPDDPKTPDPDRTLTIHQLIDWLIAWLMIKRFSYFMFSSSNGNKCVFLFLLHIQFQNMEKWRHFVWFLKIKDCLRV